MKKVIAIFVLLLIVCSVAYAETVNLKGMTTDELIVLKTAIEQELIDRGEAKSIKVPAGTYIVGEDIPDGKYSISTKQIMATVLINDYEEIYMVTPDEEVGKVTLKDGDTLQCSTGIILTKYTGLKFD